MKLDVLPRPLIDIDTNTEHVKTIRFDPNSAFGVKVEVNDVTTINARGYGDEKNVITALFGWMTHTGRLKAGKQYVTDVLFNGPATIVKFSDDTKVVTKCHKGDKFNGTFGILACAIRKLTRNRGKEVDRFEGVISDLAKYTLMPDDWRKLSDAIGMLADALEVEGVARNAATHKWEPEKAEEPVESDELDVHTGDEAREMVRNLVDDGELF